MNFALALAQNRVGGVKVDVTRFSSKPESVARQVLFKAPTKQTLESIQKALAAQQNKKNAPTPAMVAGLVIGSPDFQRR
jgi:hypothetical protein